MRTDTFYVQDEPNGVPTIAFVAAPDVATRDDRLDESIHHATVDVYDGQKLKCSVSGQDR